MTVLQKYRGAMMDSHHVLREQAEHDSGRTPPTRWRTPSRRRSSFRTPVARPIFVRRAPLPSAIERRHANVVAATNAAQRPSGRRAALAAWTPRLVIAAPRCSRASSMCSSSRCGRSISRCPTARCCRPTASSASNTISISGRTSAGRSPTAIFSFSARFYVVLRSPSALLSRSRSTSACAARRSGARSSSIRWRSRSW